jgi:hypothetical protein
MKFNRRSVAFGAVCAGLLGGVRPTLAQAAAGNTRFAPMRSNFLMPPPELETIGNAHGDIAVSPTGNIYVSVQAGLLPGIQVYGPTGRYLRNVVNAPPDLHGFIIARAPDGRRYIFGVSRLDQSMVKINLEDGVVMKIPASAIPAQYKNPTADLKINLTGIAVSPSGDIFVSDGYGLDYIHRFSASGEYKTTFGGKGSPWNFNQCHKIAFDTRFRPARLICSDRRNNRLIHLDEDGKIIGVVAEGLRLPSAMAVYENELAVAELQGRVTILDRDGAVLEHLGANDNPDEIRTNKAAPSIWREGLFYAPHGLTYDTSGNLLVTEFNEWGRVTMIRRRRA